MREHSTRQSAAMRARMRQMRKAYRRRMIVVGVILFVIGVVAGIFAQHWYAGTKPDVAAEPDVAAATVTAEPTETPEAEAPVTEEPAEETEDEADDFGWDLFDSDEADAAAFTESEAEPETAEVEAEPSSEDVAFPEVEAPAEDEGEVAAPEAVEETPMEEASVDEAPAEEASVEETPVEEAPVEEASVEETPAEEAAPEETPVPELSSDQVEEYDPTQAEVGEEYLNLADENGLTEDGSVAVAETPAEETPAEESPADEAPVDEAPVDETPAVEAAPEGPQVIAIVPYGESFTYTTQIKADGSARVDADDAPYETISFTQTQKTFMRPTDFANKYSTQYKLQGNEAGAGFELVLNDYTGEAAVVPQNVVDVSLRSESGNTVERGYQLMDAEIAGNYNVALNTNVPQMLYKRYQYATGGEEMFYLVVTTYNDGVAQQILFQLESDEPEAEPEIVYNTLQRGVKSDEVQALQQRLVDLGYLTGTADGSFGQMTEDAIKAAQEAWGMEANGIADNAFQQKLYEGVERPAATEEAVNYETLNTNSTGELVMNLQLRLRELGYYDGKADGGYGAMTEAAVKKAQAHYGMEQTGVADGIFQQKLYSDEQ